MPVAAQSHRPAMSVAEAHAILTRPGSPFEVEEVLIEGMPIRSWKGQPATVAEVLRTSLRYADRTFLVYQDERVSFDAFHRAVSALAGTLTDMGIAQGDRVAIAMRNLPEWPVAFYASAAIGAIAVPLNAWWATPELEYGLADCGARVAIMDVERFDTLTPYLSNCPELETILVARMTDEVDYPYVASLESFIGDTAYWPELPEASLPDVQIEPDDEAALFYSAGTTGLACAAVLTNRNVNSQLMVGPSIVARDMLRYGVDAAPKMDPDHQISVLLSVPLFHVTGCFAGLHPALAEGRKLVLMHRWDVETAMGLIEREQVDLCGGIPTAAGQLVDHPARSQYDMSSLKTVLFGGSPPPVELAGQIHDAWPGAFPSSGWGMTETSAVVTQHFGVDYLARPDSCGPAVAVSDLKIMSLKGDRELPQGEIGELWCRGPQVAKGYWKQPEATAAAFVDGWLRTGDIARIDEDGFCYIVDRAKDMLIRGGENIYCMDVERVLEKHPAVQEAALVGLTHPYLGEVPAAAVSLRSGEEATEEQLRTFVGEHLAAFKIPVKILIDKAPLPRNGAGKLLKKKIFQMFGE